MRQIYFDCFSGVSGDMILGALLDCGLPRSVLEDTAAALGLEDVRIKVKKGTSHAVSAVKVDVEYDRKKQRHRRNLGSICKMIESGSLKPEAARLAVERSRS